MSVASSLLRTICVSLSAGNQRLAVLLDVDLLDGEPQSDLEIGRGEAEHAVGGRELHALEHGGRGPRRDDAR